MWCCARCALRFAGGHGGNSGSSCPFATIGEEEVKQQWQRSNYHAKHQSKGMADKVRVSGASKGMPRCLHAFACCCCVMWVGSDRSFGQCEGFEMRWPPNLMIHLQAIHPVHSTCLFLLASAAGLAAHASTSYPAMILFLRFAVLCCCVM
jgi:hypothetical protein